MLLLLQCSESANFLRLYNTFPQNKQSSNSNTVMKVLETLQELFSQRDHHLPNPPSFQGIGSMISGANAQPTCREPRLRYQHRFLGFIVSNWPHLRPDDQIARARASPSPHTKTNLPEQVCHARLRGMTVFGVLNLSIPKCLETNPRTLSQCFPWSTHVSLIAQRKEPESVQVRARSSNAQKIVCWSSPKSTEQRARAGLRLRYQHRFRAVLTRSVVSKTAQKKTALVTLSWLHNNRARAIILWRSRDASYVSCVFLGPETALK